MLSERMQEALNRQVNAEFYASYLYLSMSTYFEEKNLPGFANWMRVQAQEEVTHAMRIYNHIVERGGRVKLAAIDAPPTEWDSPLDAFRAAYGHERKVTGMINDLVDMAVEEKDHASNAMLQWFVTEQVEEEQQTNGYVRMLELAGESPHALLMLDRELGARVFVMPADMQGE